MPVKISPSADGKEALIAIVGRFDFNIHEEFRQVLDMAKAGSFTKHTLDFGAVDDMDSAALGMLLLLRDTLGGDKSNIHIIRCRRELREMLEMANFQSLFRIA
jgi:anti-anti-sigma factor